MRYRAQVNEVVVDWEEREIDAAAVEALIEAFEDRYAALYGEGAGYRAAGVEVTAVRVDAIGRLPKPGLPTRAARSSGALGPREAREVFWAELGARAQTPVYRGGDLAPGAEVAGPAIVEFPDTTLVVHPDQHASADELGNFELRREVAL